ncbi:MAG: mechanosensitive ion channel family protein [Acidobacteria bacterium]|nr:mechanosensitive ion channel family protein [Acidobacteriota bacterium]
MSFLEELFGAVEQAVQLDPATRQRLLASIAIILGLWLIRFLVLVVVNRRSDDVRVRYRWKKSTQYLAVTVAVFALGVIWIQGFSSFATFLGLLSAGLAIALKDLVANFVGWAFILWRRPFEVGDRIEIGGTAGDVIDLRIFQFTLLEIGNWVDADQSTGRVIHVNNGRVFTESLANFTMGFDLIWNEIAVLVTFESDWKRAREILAEIAARHGAELSETAEAKVRQAARKFMIFYSKLTPTVYTTVRDCGVLLTIRYLCDPRRRRSTEQAIWEDILDAFAASDDIDFAYPTQRFYDNLTEGKPGANPIQSGNDT